SRLCREHEVVLVTTHGPDDDQEELTRQLSRCQKVISLPHAVPKRNTLGFGVALMRSWLSPLPVDLSRWRVPALRNTVATLVRSGAMDVCVADFLASAVNVPADGSIPTILFEHNVEHLIWKRLSDVERRPWRRALLEIEWRKLRHYEARACHRASL